MALDLLDRGIAQETYDKCLEHKADHCLFMKISDLKNGKGRCTEYQFRPLICRTFGVAGRRDKMGKINFSVCTTLKEIKAKEYQELTAKEFLPQEVPFIDLSKNRLATLDPKFLEEEFPINQSLAIMLEKILFISELDTV
jgi:Fe-S-cluster containining protein